MSSVSDIKWTTRFNFFCRRVFCFCNVEDSLSIVIMTCTGPYFLFFCRGFKLVGPMVIMVYRMLAQDIVRWGEVHQPSKYFY